MEYCFQVKSTGAGPLVERYNSTVPYVLLVHNPGGGQYTITVLVWQCNFFPSFLLFSQSLIHACTFKQGFGSALI
jgi:hypothetical protein